MAIFRNQAQLVYQGAEINSNVATGEIFESLSVTKTPITENYAQGSEIAYMINISNAGAVPRTNLTVTDDLGGYTFGTQTVRPEEYIADSIRYYENGALQPTPTITSTAPLTITGINVPAEGNTMLVYTVQTNGYAPLDAAGSITNTVNVADPNVRAEDSMVAQATITPYNVLNLTIAKSVVPVSVTENGVVTYSFVILNTGTVPATASDLVSIRDTFSPILRDISVTFDGAAWQSNVQYNYDEDTGVFSTVPGQIVVPAANVTQDPVTGLWQSVPGSATLLVSGTI